MKRGKTFYILVSLISILITLVCLFPLIQCVEKTVEGEKIVDGDIKDDTVRIDIKGFKRSYLFRVDKLSLDIRISDYEADIKASGMVSPEKDEMYSVTLTCYDHKKNRYCFGTMEFNKDFSILIITGINDSKYVASLKADMKSTSCFSPNLI